jgi:hypothetical protein
MASTAQPSKFKIVEAVVALHSQMRNVRNNLDLDCLICGRASTKDLPDALAHRLLRIVVDCCSDR